MKKDMDTIQFESRLELGELIKMIEKYVDAYPKKRTTPQSRSFTICLMSWKWSGKKRPSCLSR